MDEIKLTPEQLKLLNPHCDGVPATDESGRQVGWLVPDERFRFMRKKFYDWLMTTCPSSEEELKRRATEARLSDGIPLSQIWKELGVQQ